MSIKSILIPFSGDKKEVPALDVAFALAKDFMAHVTCLHVSDNPKNTVFAAAGLSSDAMNTIMEELTATSRIRALQAKEFFESSEKANHVLDAQGRRTPLHASAAFRYFLGPVDKFVAATGKLSDLIVMGRTIKNASPEYSEVIMTALFETGRPVLLVPPKLVKTIGYCIAIAWSGSTESARAVAHAMPLLQQARSIYIFTVKEKRDAQTAAAMAKDLGAYLKLHSLESKVVMIDKGDHSVGEAMMAEAKELKVDLLVMGAFTHNRVRQMMVGGATSHILDEARIPVLLAH